MSKKPSGPRRLFTQDNTSSSSSSAPAPPPTTHSRQTTSSSYQSTSSGPSQQWSDQPLAESPREELTALPLTNSWPERAPAKEKKRPSALSATPHIVSSGEPAPPPSPSQARWASLRQHVLPQAQDPPLRSASPPTSTISFSSFASTGPVVPNRAPAPKSSRLAARFGFRQVVESATGSPSAYPYARDTRLADDVHRACWASRYHDTRAGGGLSARAAEFYNMGPAGGSYAYLPFMSNSTLPGASTTNLPLRKQTAERERDRNRTHSVLSLPLSPTRARERPSLRPIHAALTHHSHFVAAANAHGTGTLPGEGLVLSTLLGPFFWDEQESQGDGDFEGEDERILAIDIFELVIKTWAASEESPARALFLTEALLPATTHRGRLLDLLISLPSPPPESLFALLPFLASSSLTPTSSDLLPNTRHPQFSSQTQIDIIKSLIQSTPARTDEDGAGSGRGWLPGVTVGKEDKGDVHAAGVLGALARCLEEMNGSWGANWLIRNVLQDYYPSSSPQPTPFLNEIYAHTNDALARAFLAVLRPPAPPPSHFSILTPSPLHTSSAITRPNTTTGNPPEIDQEILIIIQSVLEMHIFPLLTEPRRADVHIRLVLEVLCVPARMLYYPSSPRTPHAPYTPPPGMHERTDSYADSTYDQPPTPAPYLAYTAPDAAGDSGSGLQADFAHWAAARLAGWYRSGGEWKLAVERVTQDLLTEADWSACLRLLPPLVQALPDDVLKPVLAQALPLIYDHLPNAPLSSRTTDLLHALAALHPHAFYKPLFAVANAKSGSSTSAAQNLYILLVGLGKHFGGFWLRDPEMMSVACLGGQAGPASKNVASGLTGNGNARENRKIGQSALILELILRIKTARESAAAAHPDGAFLETVKFSLVFEGRLGILLEAKEQQFPISASQRALFCALLMELRLLTRSLKTSPCISRVVAWFVQAYEDESWAEESAGEIVEATTQLQKLYAMAQEGARAKNSRRSTVLLSPSREASFAGENGKSSQSELFSERTTFAMGLTSGVVPRALALLVALSGLLTVDDYKRLGPLLWSRCLDSDDATIVAPSCFLVMQCAEKTQADFVTIIEVDLRSDNVATRLQAIRRFGILVSWRFQILSQPIIVDRLHRRPFKLARGPLPFVATDIGTAQFIREEDPNETKDNLPLELRKRLSEIGWNDDEKTVDQKLEWLHTPMSLLPAHQLEFHDDYEGLPSPGATPKKGPAEGGLLRRKSSSSGGPSFGVKRRVIFVAALAAVFPCLARLVFDQNFSVAVSARNLLVDVMRSDPTLLARPILDMFAGEEKIVARAVSGLQALLHVRRVLPPAMAHHIFNSVAGFMKYTARQGESTHALHDYAYTLPTLSKLVHQVSDLSIREIRRAKIEVFLIPSGSLWFPQSAPAGPMFPRELGTSENPFVSVPPRLASITIIRLAQNMFFLAMLKRNPQDIQMVRKNMSRLVLPSTSLKHQWDMPPLELKDFVPCKLDTSSIDATQFGVRGLSLLLSRSYLLLVAQIFRSMSRHLSDKNELAILIDGVNRILLLHGDDIGIVTQALIALMVANTRFRRLFMSGGGYALFMPIILKLYAQSQAHDGIKYAIEYAVGRFYAAHSQSFVFQSLDTFAHINMFTDKEADWIANSVFTLITSLKNGGSGPVPDAAGIHNANKLQEREALMVSAADEKPQAFLAALRRSAKDSKDGRDDISAVLPEEYESRRLALDNLVRLFLTVIAYDPTILRAQYFLRFFRHMTPYLFNASASSRAVLRDGIDALGLILVRAVSKGKNQDAQSSKLENDINPELLSSDDFMDHLLPDKSQSPSDILAMRLDYLLLVVGYSRVGGQLGSGASQRIIDLVKILLRDSTKNTSDQITLFFNDYVRYSLIRETAPTLKQVVAVLIQLSPVFSSFAITVDFSGVLDTLCVLAKNPSHANEPTFSRLVVDQICTAGLKACELAASQNVLLSLPMRASLVRLMAQAVFFRGADIVSEIEKRTPSYQFLAGVVLPFLLALRTSAEILSEGTFAETWHRDVLNRAWVRLLWYSMSTCEKRVDAQESIPNLDRSKSQNTYPSTQSNKSDMMTLVLALQILKAIVIRGETDISTCIPGVWSRISSVLRTLLADGDAKFAFTTLDHSAPPTPSHSPRNSMDQVFPTSSSTRGTRHFLNPRIVDYSLWSLLELLCLCRTPLMVQMRLFMQEKVTDLGEDLRYEESSSILATPRSARQRSRRTSFSVYSKPRNRLPGFPSPDSSPMLVASQPIPHQLGPPSPDGTGRQPGYQRFLSSPNANLEKRGHKIVHLGPVSNVSASFFKKHHSQAGGGVRLMAKMVTVKSLELIRATYHRIRLVQTFMGYGDLLLPLPEGESEPEELFTRTWTRKQALEALVQETQRLMEEFEESGAAEEDASVVDDQSTGA